MAPASEFHAPRLPAVPADDDLTGLVWDKAATAPDAPMLSRKLDGRWVDVTAAQFRDEVIGVAKGLIAAGLAPGDRVGIMSHTRYEWTVVDFAIWAAGCVSVPVYETSSAEQVEWILADSRAVGIVVETADHAALVKEAEELPALQHVWRIEDGALDALTRDGAHLPGSVVEERRAGLGTASLATLIYTSGTTGRPKGCKLSHGNFLAEVRGALAGVPEVFGKPDAASLLFLPLAHVLARAFQLICIGGDIKLAHSADVKNLLPDLASYKPTFLLAVPRVFEKVYNGAEQKADASGKGKVFRAASATAVAYSKALDSGKPPLQLRLKHAVFDTLVYGKLRAALGGRVTYAICGGAPLGERLGHFFRGLGLVVLEGYGLTESTAAVCVNTPSKLRMGTVGPPLPGNAVRIEPDGEILVRGGVVFGGYAGNADGDAMTDDGWFRTGDLGELDAEGFLRVTGRKKEMIVTAGGKNVSPATLEDRLRAAALVSQCMVVGDKRAYIAALVTLDAEALVPWLAARGKPSMTVAEAAHDPDVRAEVQNAVDAANTAVSRAESIRRFAILDCDFTVEGGQLTPSLKVKRTVVTGEFAKEIEELYAPEAARG
ncbi:AMP-dependent synthetase/ligase [Motilibacter aurantiacus]|uniref:AMP-dependent synthetase/ligase n=1 Tax=Motilibacter aurantiacus TaxID=2714955 RepID=UPI00140B15F1|nr:long-chain fatty acid--CoA ligase [Motilibacter aurantiacus]NHC45632.1 long-chain fatty acid--CoA ligase [Motilibacter aurantiacus]